MKHKLHPYNEMVGRVELGIFKTFLLTVSAMRKVLQITKFFVVFVDFSRMIILKCGFLRVVIS